MGRIGAAARAALGIRGGRRRWVLKKKKEKRQNVRRESWWGVERRGRAVKPAEGEKMLAIGEEER